MSENNIWDRGHLAQYSQPDQVRGNAVPMVRTSIIGGICFALAGLMVTSILMGKDEPQTAMAGYFLNDAMAPTSRHALDLSRPIFVRSDVPICPSEDALSSYSSGNTQGCTILSSGAPAGLIGIVTDGMRQPTFQMQMNTPDGTIRGWVDYNNLTN
jgi:hypothetical protein